MAEKKLEKKKPIVEEKYEVLVRILNHDISGNKNVYVGLTRIKGVSWSISSAICSRLKIERNTKISDLSKEKIEAVEAFLEKLDIPAFLKNRSSDIGSGESSHLFGVKLDMTKEFDIKRLKQIKSYKGNRHALKLPVRGQRTRSNFRKVGVAVGVKKPKIGKKG